MIRSRALAAAVAAAALLTACGSDSDISSAKTASSESDARSYSKILWYSQHEIDQSRLQEILDEAAEDADDDVTPLAGAACTFGAVALPDDENVAAATLPIQCGPYLRTDVDADEGNQLAVVYKMVLGDVLAPATAGAKADLRLGEVQTGMVPDPMGELDRIDASGKVVAAAGSEPVVTGALAIGATHKTRLSTVLPQMTAPADPELRTARDEVVFAGSATVDSLSDGANTLTAADGGKLRLTLLSEASGEATIAVDGRSSDDTSYLSGEDLLLVTAVPDASSKTVLTLHELGDTQSYDIVGGKRLEPIRQGYYSDGAQVSGPAATFSGRGKSMQLTFTGRTHMLNTLEGGDTQPENLAPAGKQWLTLRVGHDQDTIYSSWHQHFDAAKFYLTDASGARIEPTRNEAKNMAFTYRSAEVEFLIDEAATTGLTLHFDVPLDAVTDRVQATGTAPLTFSAA